jgi:predicted unusual protein kinase regulating ubiquinone biosynthesis (AarF/ABC1/UbiB family)
MHGWEYTKRELEAVLGGDISSYFDSIDTVAFASGSIAQVFTCFTSTKVRSVYLLY